MHGQCVRCGVNNYFNVNVQWLVIFNVNVQWLEEEFIPYLNQWEDSVKKRTGYTAKAKLMMLLSQQTRLGITVTGKYVPFKTCLPLYVLSLQSNHFWNS